MLLKQGATSSTARYDLLQVQNNAIKGSVFNVRIKHGPNERPDSDKGRGFTNKLVVNIKGKDGTGGTPTQEFKPLQQEIVNNLQYGNLKFNNMVLVIQHCLMQLTLRMIQS